jgi:hypothetical protein
VKDPTGGVMQAVEVKITNRVSGFTRSSTTDAAGRYVLTNLPPNSYHLSVEVQGFQPFARDVDVRSGLPIALDLTLALAGTSTEVQVVGHADLIERDPTAHTDIDQSLIEKLPIETSSGGLNQVVMQASPGVVADSNGFFHPVGDHAQTQFSVDNQPITDQQSRLYSNQISQDAVQSLEVITGVAPAEYGDKSSLVVHIVTKSGLASKPTGSATVGYGSFKSPTGEVNFGGGSQSIGNFVSLSGLRTDRFLDPPELAAIHDTGHNISLFNRLDAKPSTAGTFHFNVQLAQSGFDVPNTNDQILQTQHQDVTTYNLAPGYSHVLNQNVLFTANGFVRRDHLTYLPSANRLDDTPATISQDRTLTNYGAKADLTINAGPNNIKFGGTVQATALHEQFTFGVTDPTDATFADANGNFDSAFAPFDLTNGGHLFDYDQSFTVKQQAVYIQDDIKAGDATFKAGVRVDHYDGLTTRTLAQPRLGVSYSPGASGTVLRASYGRTMETPYNENLLLGSGYGLNGLFGTTNNPVPPGVRNEGEFGVQQGIGKWLVADVGYFVKRTDNGYDFNVLFNTPIAFPIAWAHSRIDGFTGKLNLVEHGGFSAFVVMAHTSAIYSPPGVGGILLQEPPGDFRIDHDQKFNATTNLQYTFERRTGAWAALSWRYDSGLVAGSVPDYATALTLTADQQTAIGLFCGNTVATLTVPITNCSSSNFGATRVIIPGTPANPAPEDDVNNPPRIAPRNLFDLGLGVDNVLHTDKAKLKVRFSVLNLTNKDALFNFLSTFSGTHFVAPRTYQVQLGVTF